MLNRGTPLPCNGGGAGGGGRPLPTTVIRSPARPGDAGDEGGVLRCWRRRDIRVGAGSVVRGDVLHQCPIVSEGGFAERVPAVRQRPRLGAGWVEVSVGPYFVEQHGPLLFDALDLLRC